MSTRKYAIAAVASLTVLHTVISSAATFSVGAPGQGCTHTSLQAAVNAAQTSLEADFIRINGSATYNNQNQAVVINANQNLTIYGGYVSCTSDFSTDGVRATLDGSGTNAVLRITAAAGTTVTLNALTIRNGAISFGNGGGIYYQGSGVLHLQNTSVINSNAQNGGGIYAEGNSDTALLSIGSGVTVSSNTATRDGGGIFVNGMVFSMEAPNSIIAFNKALGATGKGYGGGLAIRSTGSRAAIAYVSSGGVGSLGAIYGNQAKWGGGVAVSAGADSERDAILRLFSSEAGRPSKINDNFASEGGGGIYLWPNQNFGADGAAKAIINWVEITRNVAAQGAAIYADNSGDYGSAAYFDPPLTFGYPYLGMACPVGVICNRIQDNKTADGNSNFVEGAVIYLDGSYLIGERTLITNNQSGSIVDGGGSGNSNGITFTNSLIVNNQTSRELTRNGRHGIVDSTVAGNAIGAASVFQQSNLLRRSIIWQPGKITVGSGSTTANAVIASEVGSIGGGPEAIIAEPRFIDPVRADYRLRAASPAIDYAAPITGDDRDAYGLPRDQRIATVPRTLGLVRDLGAFERQGLAPIVLNGEFDGDVNLWLLPAGHSGNYQINNAPGSTGGSAQVANLTPTPGRLLGYAQCVHIPGPGTYALNGSARSGGNNASEHNRTALIWELRNNGGEGCIDGQINLSGEHTLSTTSDWNRPLDPAQITVTEAAWNHHLSLTTIMVVYPNASNTYNGLFDRITLGIAEPSGTIFKDGFE
jgi:hypothetical protein